MTNYSLVLKATNQVMQFVSSEEETFEVHPDLFWVEGPESIEEGKTEADYIYDESGKVVLKQVQKPEYDIERRFNYPSISDQLDALWHDMESGKVPGKGKSEWYKQISEIKNQYPKE
jgi:hypothetical protein